MARNCEEKQLTAFTLHRMQLTKQTKRLALCSTLRYGIFPNCAQCCLKEGDKSQKNQWPHTLQYSAKKGGYPIGA